jgi:hypothetical protein
MRELSFVSDIYLSMPMSMSMSMSMSLSYHFDESQDEHSSPTPSPSSISTAIFLPSCLELQVTPLEASVEIETTQLSLSFSAVESMLENAMREIFPFCEAPKRAVRRLEDSADSTFYVGYVQLEEDPNQGKPSWGD